MKKIMFSLLLLATYAFAGSLTLPADQAYTVDIGNQHFSFTEGVANKKNRWLSDNVLTLPDRGVRLTDHLNKINKDNNIVSVKTPVYDKLFDIYGYLEYKANNNKEVDTKKNPPSATITISIIATRPYNNVPWQLYAIKTDINTSKGNSGDSSGTVNTINLGQTIAKSGNVGAGNAISGGAAAASVLLSFIPGAYLEAIYKIDAIYADGTTKTVYANIRHSGSAQAKLLGETLYSELNFQ